MVKVNLLQTIIIYETDQSTHG